MKFLSPQLTYLLTERQLRRNVLALIKLLAVLFAIIAVYAVGFHFVMARFEGQEHSWLTGVYWTLTVMSTLGFGDITFYSDAGRVFSILVLVTGIVMMLIVLPFAFIRFFYAPWLEAQIRLRAPRAVPKDQADHVIICSQGPVSRGLVERLRSLKIPHFLLEPDLTEAANLHADGVSVVTGDLESKSTYEALRASSARMVIANREDTTNSNIILTVRAVSATVPITCFAEDWHSIDVLDLSGATHVLPLKHRLGEHLASHLAGGSSKVHVIGSFRDVLIAEFPVHGTQLAGRSIRQSALRNQVGVSIVACWECGRVVPTGPDKVLADNSVPVVVGTREQLDALEALPVVGDANESAVVVIGAGKVGRAAIQALRERGVRVHLIEKNPSVLDSKEVLADRVIVGDASSREVLTEAGISEAPSVLLTTNNDAINIFLTVYCRRLNPKLRIVCRVTHERNVDSINRAGADFVLSYTSIGVQYVLGLIQKRELVMLGEDIELFAVEVPRLLDRTALSRSRIGELTGLTVISLDGPDGVITSPPPSTKLKAGTQMVVLGTPEQMEAFARQFES